MLINNTDYERIYRVINSIIKSEGAEPSEQCILFSVFGSAMLSKVYGFDATPKAGVAAYHLGIPDILLFGKKQNSGITCAPDGFHCWIEVDGWVIDFMAPAFSDLPIGNKEVPAKMFQKSLSEMSPAISELKKSGEYFLRHSAERTEACLQLISSKMAYLDLVEICLDWYKKPPKIIMNSIFVRDQNGQEKRVRLNGKPLVGNW